MTTWVFWFIMLSQNLSEKYSISLQKKLYIVKKSRDQFILMSLCAHMSIKMHFEFFPCDDNFFLSKYFSNMSSQLHIFTCNLSHVHTKINFLQCISALLCYHVPFKYCLYFLIKSLLLFTNLMSTIALNVRFFIYYFFFFLFFYYPPPPISSVQVESYVETKPIRCIESSFYETISFTSAAWIYFFFPLFFNVPMSLSSRRLLFYMPQYISYQFRNNAKIHKKKWLRSDRRYHREGKFFLWERKREIKIFRKLHLFFWLNLFKIIAGNYTYVLTHCSGDLNFLHVYFNCLISSFL